MEKRILATVVVVSAAASCGPVVDPVAKIRSDMDQQDLQAKAYADKRSSPARGTEVCLVKQLTSAYLTRKKLNDERETGYYIPAGTTDFYVKVERSGVAKISVSEDTYPGTMQYFLIAGRRYSSPEDEYVTLDNHALAALHAEQIVQFSWTDWPYGASHDGADILAGFTAAYNECLAFLRG